MRKALILVCLASAWVPLATYAQDQKPTESEDILLVTTQWGAPVAVPRIDAQANITVDGHLDEPEWATPPLFEEFGVIEPDTLATPRYKTEFRMFYTDKGVYASFDLEQPADTIIKRLTVRDAFEVSRDNVSFTLDTSGEGRYGYWMNLSLGDVQMDGTVLPEREYSREWDGAWYGATQTTERGWSAEFFIPWSQMAMPKVQGVRRIGLYLTRIVAHLNERWSWPMLPESQQKFMSDLQPIEFDGVDPRRQWSVFPYASVTHDRVVEENRAKAGFDIFWRPSSNFQLTATVNPDFGAVEADDVVVNLTADETFFPEKRLFFLEGQEIFTTSPRAESEFAPKITVVNTRRIGARPRAPDLPPGSSLPIREAIRPSDLLGAGKVTGQIGSFRYGILTAVEDESEFLVDDETFFQDGRVFGAFRLLYEDSIGAAYRGLGFVSTVVAHPDSDAVVHGVDFRRLSSSGVWAISGQVLYSDVDEKGSGTGGFTDFQYVPRQGLKHELQLTVLDDQIDINDLGFLVRNDTRDVRYGYKRVMSDLTRIRDAAYGAFVRYAENGEGFRTNGGAGINVEAIRNNLHGISFDLSWFGDRYDDRNSFGNGTFKKDAIINAAVSYNTNESRPFSAFGRFRTNGEAVGGRTYQYAAGIEWRPNAHAHLNLELKYDVRDGWLLHQEDQNFTTFDATQIQPELSFDYFLTARQHFRVVLQWVGLRAIEDEFFTLDIDSNELIPGAKPPGPSDDFSVSQLNFQLRYRWEMAPLSDLLIVYTKADARRTDLQEFGDLFDQSWNMPLGDQLVVRLRYRFGT